VNNREWLDTLSDEDFIIEIEKLFDFRWAMQFTCTHIAMVEWCAEKPKEVVGND